MKDDIYRLRILKDRIFTFTIYIISFVAVIPLVLVLLFIIGKGIQHISLDFLISMPGPVGESGGGILNAIVGTFILIVLSSVFAVPIGVLIGIFLSENRNSRYALWISVIIDVFQGIPSIVVGIVVYVWVVLPLRHFSAISGAVALSIIMLPAIVKATEETMKMIPYSIKEAAYSLGIPYYRTILKVILPASIPGILSGILLSTGRISGETAPLLFTAFGSNQLVFDIFKPMNALPLLIFNYAKSPYPEWHELAWAASFVLIILVFTFNIIAALGEARWKTRF